MNKILGLSTALILAGATVASAQITYLDASHGTSGNTTLTDGSQWDPISDGGQGAIGDTVWAQRTGFGNSGNIYQSRPSGGDDPNDDAHPLLTTISGLTPGANYNVYAYFWSDTSGWLIQAGFDLGSLTLFAPDPAGGHGATPPAGVTLLGPTGGADTTVDTVAGEHFTTSVRVSEGNRRLYQGDLGVATADINGEIGVFLDDQAASVQNQRTWYDGVGTQLIPEPTGLVLIAFGGLLALFTRRR